MVLRASFVCEGVIVHWCFPRTYLQLSDFVQVSIAFMCLVWVGITFPYRAPEFTPGFYWGSCHSIFSFKCMFCRSLFLCAVCSSSIYGFWRYLLKVQPSMCECTSPGLGFPTSYVVVFHFVFRELRREVVVPLVDIGGIVQERLFFSLLYYIIVIEPMHSCWFSDFGVNHRDHGQQKRVQFWYLWIEN